MSAVFYVQDAVGEKFLFTVADADYERDFRKHAAWWMRYCGRPSAHKDTDSSGRPVRLPAFPCRVVIEPQLSQ